MKLAMYAAGAAMAGVTCSSAAAARDLPADGVTRAEIAQWLQGHGYKADMHNDANGEPIISSGAQGINFDIYFYGCTAGRCRSFQYAAGWTESRPLDKLNAWNRDKRWIRSYLTASGKSVYGEYDVKIAPGGTWEQVDETLDQWNSAIVDFRTYMGF